METDQSLSAFAGQFVPLKITTDGNPEWAQWSRKYRFEGKGIPILYVVRADGKQLYAKSGSLPGPALPQMLLTTLRQSGRVYSEAEARLLGIQVKKAREAIEKKNPVAAAQALSSLKKLGTLGQLGSFAPAALEADQLVAKTRELAETMLNAVDGTLSDLEAALPTVLRLVEGEKAFIAFPKLRGQNQKALAKIKRDKRLATTLEQAKALERARRYAAAELPAIRKRAIGAFQLVIDKYPDSAASKLATAELKELGSAAKSTPSATPKASFRTWTDVTGKFKLKAKLVAVANGQVTLQKLNGEKLVLPLNQLSVKDQKVIQRGKSK